MYIKESLIKAEAEAKELSLKNKDHTYYVVDKKNKKALCYGIDYFAMSKITFEKYHPVCRYINGIRKP